MNLSSKSGPAIGIDLGTTNSCVGIFRNDNVEIIYNAQGYRTTSSIVAFTSNERLIGDAAKSQAGMNPGNTVFDVKRLIGRKFNDPEVQADMEHFSFKVINKADKPAIQVNFKHETIDVTPEEISSMLLAKLREAAESYLGVPVRDAVITVPAYFNDSQRQATKDAGTIAGLNVLRIINEPTAAAFAYGLDKKPERETLLVFDLGGGTFDVSLLTLEEGVSTVLSTAGDTRLGGGDFDNRLVEHFKNEFYARHKRNLSRKSLLRLKTACEHVKRILSDSTRASINIESLEGIDYSSHITRSKFEELCREDFKKTIEPVERVLRDGDVDKSAVNEIVLVGGSTRIPKIRKIISELFGGKTLNETINPDEAVAHGAAIQAAILSCDDSSKSTEDILLVDVTPLSLGVRVTGGKMNVVIPRNTTIPNRATHNYTTNVDGQTKLDFQIYEGEFPNVEKNNLLGKALLTDIQWAVAGLPNIEVTFEINADGILNVSAVDTSTGNSRNITITNDKGRLSKEEIERMIADAAKYKAEDEALVASNLARNLLEDLLTSVDQEVEDNPDLAATAITEEIKAVSAWLNSNEHATKAEYETQSAKLRKIRPSIKQNAKRRKLARSNDV
jgi:heat shock protein 1/8